MLRGKSEFDFTLICCVLGAHLTFVLFSNFLGFRCLKTVFAKVGIFAFQIFTGPLEFGLCLQIFVLLFLCWE